MALLDYVDPEAVDGRPRELLAADADYYGRPSLFAEQVARDPKGVDEAHLDALREAGFDDPAIVRLLAVATAAAVAANVFADALGIHPSDRDEPFGGTDARQ